MSSSGHAAHPDEIIASCQALQAHLQKLQDDAEATLREWENSIKERELAEKRRVAPGWLDRDEKILEPERKRDTSAPTEILNSDPLNIMDSQDDIISNEGAQRREGEELDRAFGGMGLR